MFDDSLPFEPQLNLPGQRTCGAAVLVMVYRSFGFQVDQESIWNELKRYSPKGNRAQTVHLSRNALEHGLAAIPCRLAEPGVFLPNYFVRPDDVRIVLNIRVRSDSPLGHFAVLSGFDPLSERVFLHDPQFGADRSMMQSELFDLWTPQGVECEITGNVALLFARHGSERDEISCPKCNRLFDRGPFQKFSGSFFSALFCPECDARLRFY